MAKNLRSTVGACACILMLVPNWGACLSYAALDPQDAGVSDGASSLPGTPDAETARPLSDARDEERADVVTDAPITPPDAPGPLLPRVEYVGTTVSLDDTSNYTFDETTLGDPATNRTIVMVLHGATDFEASYESVTIAGQNAQKVVSVGEAEAPSSPLAIFIKAQPAGVKADVRVALSHGTVRCALTVYAVYGLASLTADDTATRVSPNAADLSVDVEVGGLVLAAGSRAGTNGATASWNGVTETYDQIFAEGTPVLLSGGSAQGLSGGARAITFTVTDPTSTYNHRAIAASFH